MVNTFLKKILLFSVICLVQICDIKNAIERFNLGSSQRALRAKTVETKSKTQTL